MVYFSLATPGYGDILPSSPFTQMLANAIRLLLHGANGRLRWHDLQVYGHVIPDRQDARAFVEFTFPLASADIKLRP